MDEGIPKRTNRGNRNTIASHRTTREPQCGLKGWSVRPKASEPTPWDRTVLGTEWWGTDSELSEAGGSGKGVSRYTTLGGELWKQGHYFVLFPKF